MQKLPMDKNCQWAKLPVGKIAGGQLYSSEKDKVGCCFRQSICV